MTVREYKRLDLDKIMESDPAAEARAAVRRRKCVLPLPFRPVTNLILLPPFFMYS